MPSTIGIGWGLLRTRALAGSSLWHINRCWLVRNQGCGFQAASICTALMFHRSMEVLDLQMLKMLASSMHLDPLVCSLTDDSRAK